ncbi:MAG: DNA repair protein RecO [bacterium]
MSSTFRSQALVLDRVPYKDYDRIYTLLTLERGLVRARAKGAMRSKAKVRPHLEGLGLVDVMLVQGKGGYILASAEMTEPVRMRSLESQLLAITAERVLGRALREAYPDREVFDLALSFLKDLSHLGEADKFTLKCMEIHFFWSLLGHLGYNGSLDKCNLCGHELHGAIKFVPAVGAFFCGPCTNSASVIVTEDIRAFLKNRTSSNLLPKSKLGEFYQALKEHFSHRLEISYPALAIA